MIDMFIKEKQQGKAAVLSEFTMEKAQQVKAYHSAFSHYQPTPLVDLKALAQEIGVGKVLVKDESKRFDLNAFKVLGGSFAIANAIAKELGFAIADVTLETLKAPQYKEALSNMKFITATDGNHGRGIAWTARELGVEAEIYMPYGAVQRRIDHITALGAKVHKMDMTFDDTARYAFELSKKNGWIMVQDTTFDGYEEFPKWCMQGYLTMALEVYEAMEAAQVMPTHIFMQAGAGSLAGGIAAFFANAYGDKRPQFITVEASDCGCIKNTAMAADGKLHRVHGDLETIMAGLSVGEVCTVGWEILDKHADAHMTCADEISALGMRVLAAPCGDDARVISGESGSVGLGAVVEMMENDQYAKLRQALQLDDQAVILCFNTEGDTDPENYKKIVWEGAYGSK